MFELSIGALLFSLLIFLLRVINYAISTIRLVLIARDMRFWSAFIAFMEALIFALVMARVLDDVTYMPNLLAYCLGAAVGSYVGQWLEARFVVSYSTATIITVAGLGQKVAEALRDNNYGATITHGEGRDGDVDMVRSSLVNRDIPHMMRVVKEVAPEAFIEIDAARSLTRGWIPGGPARRNLNA